MNKQLDLNEKTFEKEVLPLFNKFYFSSNEPFLLPHIDDKTESDNLFSIIYHASIYKHLCFFKNIKLNYKEYSRLFNTTLSFETYNGFTYVKYLSKPIIKIGTYTNEDNTISNSIYPLVEEVIQNDIESLKLLDELDKQIKNADQDFNSSNKSVFDGFEDFEEWILETS